MIEAHAESRADATIAVLPVSREQASGFGIMKTDARGRIIHFEGTYTYDFSGNPDKTPRYNYNQVLYRLVPDLYGLLHLRGAAALARSSVGHSGFIR